MATTFTAELLDNEQLPHELRESFYHKMKQTVVVVKVDYDCVPATYWGGIGVGKDGLVVTAAHILGQGRNPVSYRCHNESKFYPAKVLYTNRESNLALLRRQVGDLRPGEDLPQVVHYVDLCSHEDIRVGKEAIAIGHPKNMVYTIAIGHVAYPADGIHDPYKDVSCVEQTCAKRRLRDCRTDEDEDLQVLRGDLHVIQLNNIHGSLNSAGSAIFSSAGRLMGMEIFVNAEFDFCVHVSTLQPFIEQGLEAERSKEQRSQGSPRTKKNKQRKPEGNTRGTGRKFSLTKLTTKRDYMKLDQLRFLEVNTLTTSSRNQWKIMAESHKGTSAMADSKEKTWFDEGYKEILGKDQSDVESVPQNKKEPNLDKLDRSEPGGEMDIPSFLKMDMKSSIASISGDSSARKALPRIGKGYALLDHASSGDSYNSRCWSRASTADSPEVSGESQQDQVPSGSMIPAESTMYHQDVGNACAANFSQNNACHWKSAGDKQSSCSQIFSSTFPSVRLLPAFSEKTTTTRTAQEIIRSASTATEIRKSLPVISVERQGVSPRGRQLYNKTTVKFSGITKLNINTSFQNVTSPVRFSETKVDDPLYSASKMSSSLFVKKYALSSPSLKRKILEETKRHPECLKPQEFTTQRRISLEASPTSTKKLEVSRTVDKKLVVLEAKNPVVYSVMENVVDLELPMLVEGNVDMAEGYAKKLDDISNMLRKKIEEAEELLVHSVANKNALMLLNHPMHDEKAHAILKNLANMQSREF